MTELTLPPGIERDKVHNAYEETAWKRMTSGEKPGRGELLTSTVSCPGPVLVGTLLATQTVARWPGRIERSSA